MSSSTSSDLDPAVRSRRRWSRLPPALIALVSLAGAGCRHDDYAPYATLLPPPPPLEKEGAYGACHGLGIEAEAAVRGIQRRASPSSREVREIDLRLTPMLAKLSAAARLPVTDDYVPQVDADASPARIGWAALGGTLDRRLHSEISQQAWDAAIETFVDGTRFALSITAGDASDALVGYPIADSLRRQLAPFLRELSPAQLAKLADAMTKALLAAPPSALQVEHERLAMLAGVESVQDAYQRNELSKLENDFGKTTDEAFETLRGYRGNSESKRAQFISAMAADVESEATWLSGAVDTPASRRMPEPNPKPNSKQPWHALSRQFVLAGGPMLAARDLTLARTRLFALSSELYAISKTSGVLPHDLHLFPPSLTLDPYTGRSFYFVPEGLDFRIYSAGLDGMDNGGDTDDTGIRPDLTLEGAG